MAETDILNPPNWSPALDFNPNPSYGFTRKSGANRITQRPRLGTFPTREVGNAGHAFPMVWIGIPYTIVQRIEQFFHSFKAGYFTYIDIDGGGRHFVGRFMSEPESVHTANGKYNIQNLQFEEIPLARMLSYPNNFTNDGHTINVVDDYLKPRFAGMVGNWIAKIGPQYTADQANAPAAYVFVDAVAAPGDWAQAAYVGWGFQLTFLLSASLGTVDIALDGVTLVTGLNLVSGYPSATSTLATVQVIQGYSYNLGVSGSGSIGGPPPVPVNPIPNPPAPASVVVTVVNIPLDAHRVRVTASANTAPGSGIIFPPLTYIY